MNSRIKLTILGILFSLEFFAQGKLYIVPQIDCFVGSIRGTDSINNKQFFIKTKDWTRKTFLFGIRLTYTNKSFGVSAGIDQALYSSAFYRNEDKSNANRIDSKHWEAEGNGPSAIFIESGYELLDFKAKMPAWLSHGTDKSYLFISRVAPLFGFEYRYMHNTFINHFTEYNVVIPTSQYGNIPGQSLYHAYKNTQVSLRVGADWVFLNEGKRRFVLTFMYHFAFKDAGYFRYHFYKPGVADFYYQTITKGNGFSIKAGVPIKIYENKKKR